MIQLKRITIHKTTKYNDKTMSVPSQVYVCIMCRKKNQIIYVKLYPAYLNKEYLCKVKVDLCHV